MSSRSDNLNWKEAREIVRADSTPSQDLALRRWFSRTQACQKLKNFSEETLQSSTPLKVGDYGICRNRLLPLGARADSKSSHSGTLEFGDLYSVVQVSPSGRWISISSLKGEDGWIPREKHYGITAGEFKILNTPKKSRALNFVINCTQRVEK